MKNQESRENVQPEKTLIKPGIEDAIPIIARFMISRFAFSTNGEPKINRYQASIPNQLLSCHLD